MATITANSDSSILRINKFLGLNENLDGSTTLKVGEMSEMRNFKITQDGHLQIRPGAEHIMWLPFEQTTGDELWGVWRGPVGGKDHVLASFEGHVYDVDLETKTAKDKGAVARAETNFFAFDGKVYLLNGQDYMSWDGSEAGNFTHVEGYAPLVQTATTPEGKGTLVEPLNRLTDKRRVEFSPDGTAKDFQLPEKKITEVLWVKVNGEPVKFNAALLIGTIHVLGVPPAGTNTMEVCYRIARDSSAEEKVYHMKYSELFNGASDSRVFLYGDGTNVTIYSGVRYDTGQPSAEYFPELYEIAVGASNSGITSLIRHYSKMMAFKANSAWSIQYGNIALADQSKTPAFYVTPVNRQFGNEAMGQAKLLENNPLTLDVGSIYRWRTSGGYIGNNENNAERISDRVVRTLESFDFSETKTYNMKSTYEFWFVCNGIALILNYANDTWYKYEGLPFTVPVEVETEIYGFTPDGQIVRFSRECRNDLGNLIDCYAATGSMDFSKDYLLKYSPMIFVAMQPERNARIMVTAETNRRSDYPDKVVAYNFATFAHVDFRHFSFATNRKPQVRRVKLKVKKATYYRLIFKSNSDKATATVIEADIQMRFAGLVK